MITMNEWILIFVSQIERAASEYGDKRLTKEMNDEDFQMHLDYMVHFATMGGASEARAKDEMLKVLKFEQSLMKVYVLYLILQTISFNIKINIFYIRFLQRGSLPKFMKSTQ